MASARVSVALCTHNGAAYIADQLASIAGQSPAPAEVVLSDDASTDDTVAIARTVMTEHPGIDFRVLENRPALGVTRNFEQAITACTGDLVALSDQDDLWHPGRLAVITAIFADRPELLLLHGDARLVDGTGAPLGHTLFEAIEVTKQERDQITSGSAYTALLRRNLVTGATTVFRRELVQHALPFPPSWVHDEWLAIVAAATGRVDFVPDALIDYRQHGANAIGATKLSFSGKVGRMMEPRGARNERLAANFAILRERLATLGVTQNTLALADGKLAHERVRLAYPAARILRIGPVLREARTGRYRAFSRSRMDIVRDLLQPAG